MKLLTHISTLYFEEIGLFAKNIHTPFPWKILLRIQSKISEDSNMILTKDISKILSKILLKILYNPN